MVYHIMVYHGHNCTTVHTQFLVSQFPIQPKPVFSGDSGIVKSVFGDIDVKCFGYTGTPQTQL